RMRGEPSRAVASSAASNWFRATPGAATEEHVLKTRLKIAPFSFADTKARANGVLQGAINFEISTATPFQLGAHSAGSECRRIAIAGEMAEHDALDFSR